jgi:hypothetical protein
MGTDQGACGIFLVLKKFAALYGENASADGKHLSHGGVTACIARK